MAKYEVFIPAALASEFNVTLRVDADNWMAALKSGLTKLGEKGTQVVNIMVDIMEDNSIHVSDMGSGRVFRIKELEETTPIPAALPMAAPAPVAVAPIPLSKPAAIPLAQPAPVAPVPRDLQVTERLSPSGVSPVASRAPARLGDAIDTPTEVEKAPVAPPVKTVRHGEPLERSISAEERLPVAAPPKPEPAKAAAEPRASRPAAVQPQAAERKGAGKQASAPQPDTAVARKVEQVAAPSKPVQGPIGRSKTELQLEEIFSDLFERTQDAYGMSREKALEYLLDLAMEKIPADAGSVFISDLATADLALLSARGPKARELEKMKLKVPMGVGIVGFCAQEAVGVAISDTERDPRFYRNVSEKIGYATKSILCAPMVADGRTFGCLEIINKKGSSHFTDAEMAILGYVAHQGARCLEQT